MAQRNPDDLIKVYVTAAQREELEFLVNRRRNDLEREGRTATDEFERLTELKRELFYAGT